MIRFYVKDFIRKIQWRSILRDSRSRCRFNARSSKDPPTALVRPELRKRCHRLLAAVNSSLRKCDACYPASNLTSEEQAELQRLRSDPSLTILPADKGGKWVVMRTEAYVAEAESQLHNTQCYAQTAENLDLHIY